MVPSAAQPSPATTRAVISSRRGRSRASRLGGSSSAQAGQELVRLAVVGPMIDELDVLGTQRFAPLVGDLGESIRLQEPLETRPGDGQVAEVLVGEGVAGRRPEGWEVGVDGGQSLAIQGRLLGLVAGVLEDRGEVGPRRGRGRGERAEGARHGVILKELGSVR
jgi:hypothetical protein